MLYGKKVIALCIANAGDWRNFEFISALNNAVEKKGHKLFIYHTCTDFYRGLRGEEGEKAVFDLMDYDVIDAVVVFCDSFKDDSLLESIFTDAGKHGKPIVSIGEQWENRISLLFDDERGFEEVVRHVVEEHEIHDTCLIAGVQGEKHSERRIQVYKKVLEENGILFDDENVYYGDYWWGPTRKSIRNILRKGEPPKAIICANDSMAIAACEELRSYGYSIPEQVAVTGFDGLNEAMYNNPPLTTAKCDMELVGEHLVDVLEKLFDSQPVEKVHTAPYTLDVYSSCGCHRKALHEVNLGERMKWVEDRFIKYQDDERTLMEVSEQLVECESPSQFAQCLRQFPFFNVSIVLNGDCLDETTNPAMSNRTESFDEEMWVVFSTKAEGEEFPVAMPRKKLLPDMEERMKREEPVLFTCLSFLGKPFGYMYFGNFSIEEYAKILQCAKTLGHAFGSYRIIKNLKYTALSIEQMSRKDYLTGLNNRAGFYAKLPDLLSKARGKHIMVATVDVDKLKPVNDGYGHNAGDYIIKSVAKALEATGFEEKICGRFGGDEMVFCAVVDGTEAEERLCSEMEHYLEKLNKENDRPYDAQASIGVVTMPAEKFDIITALKKSDQLMYENKKRKKAERSA